jgi:uncharacterized membrane protein YkvA (DUF1232 family)
MTASALARIVFGMLDDIAVCAIAARLLRKDLEAYCEFKGYAPDEHFGRRA